MASDCVRESLTCAVSPGGVQHEPLVTLTPETPFSVDAAPVGTNTLLGTLINI